jgi:hypothetical protein
LPNIVLCSTGTASLSRRTSGFLTHCQYYRLVHRICLSASAAHSPQRKEPSSLLNASISLIDTIFVAASNLAEFQRQVVNPNVAKFGIVLLTLAEKGENDTQVSWNVSKMTSKLICKCSDSCFDCSCATVLHLSNTRSEPSKNYVNSGLQVNTRQISHTSVTYTCCSSSMSLLCATSCRRQSRRRCCMERVHRQCNSHCSCSLGRTPFNFSWW